MNGRDNLLRALRREGPDYVPHAITLCDAQLDRMQRESGTRNPDDFFKLDYRYLELNPTRLTHQYDAYFEDHSALSHIDEWGVGWRKPIVEHLSGIVSPMRHFTSVEEIEAFPLPDLMADYRWEGFAQRVEECKKAGCLAVYFAVQIFEPAWYLRGMEPLLMDMLEDDPKAAACLERINAVLESLCRRLAECGIDLIVYGDDVGTQKGLLMDRELWRERLKPGMRRVIQAAKGAKPDLLAFYHSDGAIEPLIEDLIEIGVDVLNPVQPECMDPKHIMKAYGDRLSFWGTIGTQTTLPFGTPAEVRAAVEEMILAAGKRGGLVVAPTHVVEPDVPWENILAFRDAALRQKKNGKG